MEAARRAIPRGRFKSYTPGWSSALEAQRVTVRNLWAEASASGDPVKFKAATDAEAALAGQSDEQLAQVCDGTGQGLR